MANLHQCSQQHVEEDCSDTGASFLEIPITYVINVIVSACYKISTHLRHIIQTVEYIFPSFF